MKMKTGLSEDFVGHVNYALSKQVPDMSRGFTIQTNYGDLEVSAKDAPAFAKLAEKMLLAKVYE